MYNINMEKNFCNKCGMCCTDIAVDYSKRIMYRDGVQELSETFTEILEPVSEKNGITLCTCKFLFDRKCTNPNKPEECKNYPSSPFAFLPEDCGYSGEIFVKLEDIKHKVRKFKEEILNYEIMLESEPELERLIKHHKAFIDRYKIYGSNEW